MLSWEGFYCQYWNPNWLGRNLKKKKKPILRYLEFSSLTKGLFSLRNTVHVFFATKALLKFSILAFKWTPTILDILILSPLQLPTKNSLKEDVLLTKWPLELGLLIYKWIEEAIAIRHLDIWLHRYFIKSTLSRERGGPTWQGRAPGVPPRSAGDRAGPLRRL